ncbi:MAG: hypothetical protein LDL12_05415 [Anaerolinea sp.]|nr:hypothetical protein [Anaerolinea sp.]
MREYTALIWLLMTPFLGAALTYLIGRSVARRVGDSSTVNPARWVALLSQLATGVFLYFSAQALWVSGRPFGVTIARLANDVNGILLRFDGISLLLASVVLVLTFLVTLYSVTYMQGEVGEEKYYALLMAMTGMMIGLGCTHDLFNLWVWFEGMAISSYMLVAFYHQSASLEAGIKYLVQSAVGSVFVLLGIALIFLEAGSLNLSAIHMALGSASASPVVWVAGALLLIGFGVKTALVPLHTWLPDAHSQAPSGISAMLSGVVIEAGLVAMLRSLAVLPGMAETWGYLLLGFGALNMLVGNLMALRQTQVKRLLAYSSLAHMGYMLIGFGAAFGFGSQAGAAGGFFHLMIHMLMKGLAFLGVGAFLYTLYVAKGKHGPLMIEDLSGAARRYPLAAFAVSVAVLGLGGLPPLAGFMSKWQIFVAGFATQSPWVIGLVVFAALNSVLSLGYYAPLVNRMYRQQPSALVLQGEKLSVWLALPLVLMTVLVVVLGFWPTLAAGWYETAADSLMRLLSY